MLGLSGGQSGTGVAAVARAAGLGDSFSRHSERVGLAAELSRAGASTHEIAATGGWKSAGTVIRYTRKETARRGPWPSTSRAVKRNRTDRTARHSLQVAGRNAGAANLRPGTRHHVFRFSGWVFSFSKSMISETERSSRPGSVCSIGLKTVSMRL